MKRYKKLARVIQARIRCIESKDGIDRSEWIDRHSDVIDKIMDSAPSGSGIDCGTTLDLEKSTGEKLVFHLSYHHMNEHGMYEEWTEHSLIITPSLELDYHSRLTGRDRNDIKEYLYEVYGSWLDEEMKEYQIEKEMVLKEKETK